MYGSSSGAMATPVMLASDRILPMVRLYTPPKHPLIKLLMFCIADRYEN